MAEVMGHRMEERPVYVSQRGNVLPPPKGELPMHIMRVHCPSVSIGNCDGDQLPSDPLEKERYTLYRVKFPVSLEVPDDAIPDDFALEVACRLIDEGKLP